MDHEFWQKKWKENDIAFHKEDANPLLIKYIDRLSLNKNSRVFFPLCGKTRDIAWLLLQGYRVIGAELSEIAIKQLFLELDIEPTISGCHYSCENLDIFVGDFFELAGHKLGQVDAIYDRAALVALSQDMRKHYASHLMKITNDAQQLLICFEYEQNLYQGPPFSVSAEEIEKHYKNAYDLILLESTEVAGGLKGKHEAKENVWLLRSKK